MVVRCAHSDALAPAQMMVAEPSSVTLSVVAAVFEPLVLRAMSLTAFAPVDVTFQVANPPVAPADPASMSVECPKLVLVPPRVLPTAFAVTLMVSPPAD